jgi:hypothetical protein
MLALPLLLLLLLCSLRRQSLPFLRLLLALLLPPLHLVVALVILMRHAKPVHELQKNPTRAAGSRSVQ